MVETQRERGWVQVQRIHEPVVEVFDSLKAQPCTAWPALAYLLTLFKREGYNINIKKLKWKYHIAGMNISSSTMKSGCNVAAARSLNLTFYFLFLKTI